MDRETLEIQSTTDQEEMLLLAVMAMLDKQPGKEFHVPVDAQMDANLELRLLVKEEGVTFFLEPREEA